MSKADRLIFVYNADSNIFAMAVDFARKIVIPSTYKCNLCLVTYGPAKMRKDWQKFLDVLPYQKIFLHRDKFRKLYPSFRSLTLPVIMIQPRSKPPKVLISAVAINEVKDLYSLRDILSSRLLPSKEKWYKCEECGLEYPDKVWAGKCEDWCKEHKSCNLDIIEHARQEESNNH